MALGVAVITKGSGRALDAAAAALEPTFKLVFPRDLRGLKPALYVDADRANDVDKARHIRHTCGGPRFAPASMHVTASLCRSGARRGNEAGGQLVTEHLRDTTGNRSTLET